MLECKVTHIGAIQGFIDTNGKFHTREQALKIAQENNQIITKNYPLNKLLSVCTEIEQYNIPTTKKSLYIVFNIIPLVYP